jgi:hypothetical protein
MTRGWIAEVLEDGWRQVRPLDDLREHNDGMDCWCHPWIDSIGSPVIVHNSLDGREKVERN